MAEPTDTDALTEQVVASFDGSADPRYREVMGSLVRHLHAFARDVSLTEEEWFAGIDFLTRTGQTVTPERQEVVLLSDTLGLSMLTVGLSAPGGAGDAAAGEAAPPSTGADPSTAESPPGEAAAPRAAATEATEPTVFGPFFVEGSPEIAPDGDLAQGASGAPCHVRGRVLDAGGEALAGARVEVWQSDDEGFYDVQRSDVDGVQGRGHQLTDEDGRFAFWTVRPTHYPIPFDGPVGEMLRAGGRGPERPAHIHFMVTADGHRRLVTHLFDREDPYLSDDAVFGVKASLIVDFEEHAPDPPEPYAGRRPDEPWFTLEHDLVLAAAPAA